MVQSYQAPIRVYKYPFDAYEKRFPSCDLIPVFVDSEIIEDNYDTNTKVHVIKRRCKLKVDAPYLLKKIIGMDFVYFVQINTLDHKLKCLKIEAYNENFSTRVKMLETCYYKVHPQNPYWTCFEQEASLNIISFFNFENILEKVIIKQYIKSIGEGKEILLHFLKQMGHVEEYPDICDNLYKDLQLGSADPKVLKNRLKMSFRGKPVTDTPDYIILTTFQSQKLSEFKEILTGKFSGKMPNDTHLMRFLAARDMDVLKACEMLLASLMWRKHHRIDQILQNYKVPEVLEKYYPGGWLKNDTNKVLPLYYLRLGQMDIKGLYNSIGLDGIIKHTLYVCEQGLDLCRSSFPCSSALDNGATEQKTPNNKSSNPLFPSTLSSPALCLKQNHSKLTTINPLKSVHQDSLIQSKAFKNKAKSDCNLTKKDTVVDIQQNHNDDLLNLKNTANSVNNERDAKHFPRKTSNLAENSQSLRSSFLFSTTTLSDEAGDDMTSGIVTQESDEFTSQRSTSMSTDVAYQSRTEIHANHPNTNNFAQKDLRKKLFNPSLSMTPNRNSSPCFSSGISSNDGSQHFVMNSEIGQLPTNQPTEINVKSNNHIQNSQSKKRNSDCVSAYVSPYAWNLMLDLRGLSVKHLWTPGLKAMSRLIEIVEANYPETLDALYIIGAPRIFSVIWSLASSMLDDKTREKIHFIALDSKEGICCTDNGAINNLNETNENIAEYSSLLDNTTGDPKFLNDEKIDHINGKMEFQALSDNKANIVSRKSSANNNNVIVKTESTNDIFNCFGFLSPNSSLSDDGGPGSPHDRNMKYLMCETHKPCAKFGALVGSWRDNENINAYLYDKDVYEMTVPKSYYLSELVLNAHKQAFDRDVYETFQLPKDNYYEVVIDINKPNTIITWDFDVLKFESTFSLLNAGRCHTFPNNSEKNIGFLSTETESHDKSFINQGPTSILEKLGNREHPIKVEFNRICHEGDSIQGSHFTKESLGTYILQWKNFSNTTMNNTTHTNNNSNCNPVLASMVKSSTVPISTTNYDPICQSIHQPISKPQNINVPSTENVSVSSSIFDFSPFFSSITSTFGPKNLDASKDTNGSLVQNSSQTNPNNVVQSPVTSPGPHQLHSSTMAMTNKCKIAYYYQVIYPQASAIQIRSSENANQNTLESSTIQLKQPNNNDQNLNEIPFNKRSSSMESVQSSLSYLSLDNGQNG